MQDDTANNHSDDSHPDFMFQRNEAGPLGVGEGMDTPTDAPAPSDHSTADDTTEYDALSPEATSSDAVDAAPIVTPSIVESAPFDYDSYYGTDTSPGDTITLPSDTAVTVEPPRRRDGAMYFVGALAAALLGSALTVGILAATGTLSTDTQVGTTPTTIATSAAETAEVTEPSSPPEVIQQTIITEGGAVNPAAVAVKTLPSIVTVRTYQGGIDPENSVGTGSGVVIRDDGYIATNEHVVSDADTWTVRFEDGRIFDAELIGQDELTDLAVLKISATDLTAIEFGDVSALNLGDPAVAVGNPLGQEGGASVSSGIVSAFNRTVNFSDGSDLFGMIQTDAAINNGSSGGALVNAEGQLIGITAAIGVSQSGPEGIGYAIPVNMVDRITGEIIETGDVLHPFLGVTITDHFTSLDDGSIVPAGAIIGSVEPEDGAAAAAGIEPGDVIVGINGEDIVSRDDLIVTVRLYRVGDEVEFAIDRAGELITFDIVLGERPDGV